MRKPRKLGKKTNYIPNDVAVFRALFEDVQQTFNRLNGARLKVTQADPAMGESLKNATVAVLDQWRKELG